MWSAEDDPKLELYNFINCHADVIFHYVAMTITNESTNEGNI